MTNLSTDELATQIIEADKAGDKSTLSALSQEWKRRKQTPQIGAPDYSSLGDATRVPGPQGFMEDSGINAIGRGIRENIGGGAGAAIGSAAGMEAGGTVGTFIGGPGVGTAVGAGVGGVGGGILGALFGGQAQQAVFPTSEDTKRILQSDETNHPMMSFAGQIIPYLATLKPSIGGIKSAITPLNATMSAAERQAVIGHRVGTVLGAGLGGASEVAMPLIQGREVDPTRVLASTVLGALFNEPNRLGKAIGLPSTPTLAEVRAKQMAASMPEVPTSTAMVPFEQAPLIPTEVVNPRAVGMPETGAYPVGNTDVRFVQPRMLEGDAPPLQLPASAEAGADTVMPAMRQEQAAAMQEQLTRLTERRAGMASRGAGKPALAAVDKQIKARQNALKGLQNESTIIAPPAAETGLPIVEQGVAVPPPDRTPVAVETPPPMDPRMRALATGEDRIATGERPAFMSADAITQERLARDAAAQSSSNAVALREQLATQETTPRTTARAEDFSNPNEFYRVIVGDDAFNDIISTGTVRTNASSKVEPGASITQRLKGRPTAFPSFSKGQVSLSYAGENPGHYVVVTSDPSMMPSSSGRHSKGKTMFPTNDAGEHMTHLSGKSVRVFKHMGDGQYDLVYDRGSVIGGRNKFPSAQSPSNAVVVKALDGADLDNLGAAAGVKRQGVGDEAYREKIIGNTHPDDLQDAINATSNPTHNEKSPSISGKPSPADSVTPVSDVPSVVEAPEVVRTIPEDLTRARENMAKGGAEAERVKANTEPVAAFRKPDGELKLYDGHHRLVNAIDSGAETIPVKIDGEGVKDIPVSAFDTAINAVNESAMKPIADAPNIPSDGPLSVYPRKINGEDKWMVQQGDKRGFGDSIHDSQIDANVESSREATRRSQRAETLRELDAKAASDAAAKADREDLGTFTDGMKPMQKGTVVKHLSADVNYRGTIMSRRDLIKKLVAEGRDIDIEEGGRVLSNSKGEFLSEKVLTKAGMDYASHLIAEGEATPGLRNQLAKLDEDIALAHDDGDVPGVRALEVARGKIQAKMDEAASPTMPKTLGDKIRAKKAKLKGDTFNLPIAGISGDDARRLWNGALEVAAKLADAGTNIREAAKQAAAWARQQFPRARFKDDEFHSAIEADVVEGLGAARKAGVKEESFKAAEQMDNNPDKFFADAGETPVSSYMDSVSQTMKDAKHDMLSGRTAKRVWQHLKDFNRNFLRGNQAALDDLAKGGSGTGRKSPALEKLNERINGTRPGAPGVSKRGLYDEVITNARARSNELNAAYNGIRSTVDTLKGHEKDAFLANLVKWMQMDNSPTHLRNQPAILKAVDTIRKVSRDIIEDLKKVGIDIGDSGIKYFNRSLDADVVKRNYDEFVTGMAKIYDQQWKQTDPKYVSDMAKATEAAKAYADATILGHDDIHLDGSDLLLSGKQRTSDPDFFKARTFTGAAGDELDRTMAKFYKRNPFETINTQINRAERRIGLAKAFGKTTWDADAGKYVLDPTARWKEFTDAAIKEGNEKIVPEVRERYQTMFGIGGNFNPSTMAFNQFTREMGYYAYLPFSGINSMVEPTVMAMRLNKPVSGLFQAYGKTFRSIARQLKDMPLDYKEKLADALGLAENATMRAARSLGRMDEQGMMTSKNLASYMFLTGNSVVSNATSNAAVDIGMSALRVALLDHQHGQGGNTPRIWLEELGIKKADFDAVSKWLEGHVTDEDRFGAVLDGSREANIVRDALSKFVREGRSLPDAGTKSKTFSSPAGSMLLSLQSFLYDFADKVLGRNARQFMQGVKGEVHFDGDIDPTKLSAQDRMHLMAPMAMGMPALLAANYGIALIRETMYPDPEKIRRDRERTNGEINWNRFQRALSRTNALGPYDMLFNMFTQARYERDVAAMAVGPYMGGVLELAKNVAALSGERNSGNTNTAERKAVRSAWNIGPKPLLNMALSSLPATRALTPIAAAGIQIGSQRSAAEGAVDLVAGKAQDTRNKKKSK